jgi:hypothetical protein
MRREVTDREVPRRFVAVKHIEKHVQPPCDYCLQNRRGTGSPRGSRGGGGPARTHTVRHGDAKRLAAGASKAEQAMNAVAKRPISENSFHRICIHFHSCDSPPNLPHP